MRCLYCADTCMVNSARGHVRCPHCAHLGPIKPYSDPSPLDHPLIDEDDDYPFTCTTCGSHELIVTVDRTVAEVYNLDYSSEDELWYVNYDSQNNDYGEIIDTNTSCANCGTQYGAEWEWP